MLSLLLALDSQFNLQQMYPDIDFSVLRQHQTKQKKTPKAMKMSDLRISSRESEDILREDAQVKRSDFV